MLSPARLCSMRCLTAMLTVSECAALLGDKGFSGRRLRSGPYGERSCAQATHSGRWHTLVRHSYRPFGQFCCTSTEAKARTRVAAALWLRRLAVQTKLKKIQPRIGQSAHAQRPERMGDLGSFWTGDVAACGWWERRYVLLWRSAL